MLPIIFHGNLSRRPKWRLGDDRARHGSGIAILHGGRGSQGRPIMGDWLRPLTWWRGSTRYDFVPFAWRAAPVKITVGPCPRRDTLAGFRRRNLVQHRAIWRDQPPCSIGGANAALAADGLGLGTPIRPKSAFHVGCIGVGALMVKTRERSPCCSAPLTWSRPRRTPGVAIQARRSGLPRPCGPCN